MNNKFKVYKDLYNKYKYKYSKDEKIQFINLIEHKIRQQKNLIEDLDPSKNEFNSSLVISIGALIVTVMLALDPKESTTGFIVIVGVLYLFGLLVRYYYDRKKYKKDELYIKEIKKNISELEMIKSIYKHLLIDEDNIVL
ncbi:MAG: hypothetical protein KZY57_13140 [Paeniclostridium sp.]|nr:hypothetical protein [Paeniclostridium sp.]MBW4863765.1 hypothetical protein [Paeniclostridium sp.]